MRRPRNEDFAEEEAVFRKALDAIPPPTPPDGGWGWVVVVSSFFMNMIVDGVCYSYGILLSDMVSTYHSSTAVMSLGGALLLGTYMMSGKLGGVTTHPTHRLVCVRGLWVYLSGSNSKIVLIFIPRTR